MKVFGKHNGDLMRSTWLHHFARIIILMATLICGAACAEDLHILTTDVPPFSFVKDGKSTGFCIDIVEDIQRRIGDKSPVEVFPWARAYQIAQIRPRSVLVCPKRTLERESLFKWVGPLFKSDTDFFAKSDSLVQINSLQDARNLVEILVPRASYSYQYLLDNGFKNLRPVNDLPGMLRMLLAGRAPVMVFDRPQMDAILKQEKIPRSEIKSVYRFLAIPSALAFSKDTPDATVRQWQAALDAMKKDGSYARLHDKWFAASMTKNSR